MNLGEATRLYQAALEERRVMRDRGDDADGRMEEMDEELQRADDELWDVWYKAYNPLGLAPWR